MPFLLPKFMTEQEVKKFYNSKKWKLKRLDILKRDHFECQDCIERLRQAAVNGEQLQGEDREIRRAEEVHHIKELREYPELGLEDDNLISLCTQCHNIRHGRYIKRFVKKKKRLTEEMW